MMLALGHTERAMTNFEIREVTEGRGQVCNGLLRTLPLWFGIEEAIRSYVSAVESMPMLVAFAEARPVGFLSIQSHNEFTARVWGVCCKERSKNFYANAITSS